jgi:hypothetical protein
VDWHCSEDCLGRSAAIERKPTPFYILSLSRSLPPHRLAAFGLDYPLLAGGEKRTVIRPGANGGRRRPRKEQDDMPLRTLRRGERRRRLVHGLVPFFSGSETRRRASTLATYYAHPAVASSRAYSMARFIRFSSRVNQAHFTRRRFSPLRLYDLLVLGRLEALLHVRLVQNFQSARHALS